MQIPQLQMQSTSAKIGISSTKASQSIQQPSAKLDLESPKAQMTIRTTPGRLTIDQSQAWAAMGLKRTPQLIREAASKGMQEVQAGMSRRTSEGNQLMEIEKGGRVIQSIAARNSNGPEQSFNIGFIPPPFSVKVRYQQGSTHIDASPQKVINRTRAQKPIIDHQAGDVSISMRQRESLNIRVVNTEI
ncbi:DUF6470 family protein [Jeotgalibacillus campisalis]|uniref:Uncharacterized protein n=1 Tax=Jeotgalibacillus campisalis TaxID=220754 RepID=A0A0C2QY70_9BACL|nr:DUF6470 family protein [Jeotgalibacillus campisalis]KIL42975.1 hypothetical protein KR50_33780 [Jeotgalibacillus campisalis]